MKSNLTLVFSIAALLLAGGAFIFNGGDVALAQVKMTPYLTPQPTNRISWDYDSGWQPIGLAQNVWLPHGLGGDPGQYLVNLTGKSAANDGIHQVAFGSADYEGIRAGCIWCDCTQDEVLVRRSKDDTNPVNPAHHWDFFRLRILKNQ